jgi:hypothetical protein
VAALAAAEVGPGVGRRGSRLVSGCAVLRDPPAGNVMIDELTYCFGDELLEFMVLSLAYFVTISLLLG